MRRPLFLLLLTLVIVGIWFMRKGGPARKAGLILITGLLLLGAIGAFVVDGEIGDWAGHEPLALDVSGDSGGDVSADLRAFYAGYSSRFLFFRFDIADLEGIPPLAAGDSYGVDEGAALVVDSVGGVLANDQLFNVNGSLTAVLDQNPSNGALVFAADGSFTYTHDGSQTTADQFSYHAFDGLNVSPSVSVDIAVTPVNDAPVANGQAVATVEDIAVAITLTGDDIENDGLAYNLASGPTNGVLSGALPQPTYTPNPDFNIRPTPT